MSKKTPGALPSDVRDTLSNSISGVASELHTSLPSLQAVAAKRRLVGRFRVQGIAFGLISGISFGLFGVISGAYLESMPFIAMAGLFAAPMVASAICDTCSTIWVLFFNLARGAGKEILRSLRTFPGLMAALCGFVGGPLANGMLLVGISLAGPAYALPISALCPVFGALFARIFLKQKLSIRILCGMLICIIGAIVISYEPPEGASSLFYIGILCSLIAALAWGAEGALGVFGMSMIDSNISIQIRQGASALITLLVIVPLVAVGWGALIDVLAVPATFWLIALGGLCTAISYLSWYASNCRVGVATGMTLNITYVLWGVVFSLLILASMITPQIIVGALAIMVGATLVSLNPLSLFKRREI
ncbi:MAG: DMT family transporter [Dehalococcoidia bacterium]|nr:DMT family transporter [Dehalococcoidia bacterium]